MKRLIGFIIIFVSLLIFPAQVMADDFTIDQMTINVYLQNDGHVQVEEVQTYQFDGKFNGITRTLFHKEGTNITNVQAFENGEALNVLQEGSLYRIFRHAEDETVTISFVYTIEDGVTVYTDVAEFYWGFFDTSNPTPYEQLDIIIHPPQPTSDVIAFGYDVVEGSAQIEKNGTVHFKVGYVPEEKNGNIRVAYDETLFPNAKRIDTPMRGEILEEQNKLEAAREAFENSQQFWRDWAPVVISIFVIYLLSLLVYAWRQKRRKLLEISRKFVKPFFVPEEIMSLPATIYYMKGIAGGELLTASLLDLVRKGFVKQEDENTFTVVHTETDYDHEHEGILIQWLFKEVGQDGVFRLADLERYTKGEKNAQKYYKRFTDWQNSLQKEIQKHQLTEKLTKQRTLIALSSVLLLPFTVIYGIYELYAFMVLAIVLFIGLLLFAGVYSPRTMKGHQIKNDWSEFQSKYDDMDLKAWEDLRSDEQQRAFIYGIGIGDKQIDEKNETLIEHFPQTVIPDTNATINPALFILFISSANASFTSANRASATSSMGSTGGGSIGGGTGVGGSGGGSGAF